jgi:regulatory protein
MAENTLFKTVLKKAMGLCAHREFCISEFHDKLQTWGVEDIDKEKIIDILISENFINEARYSVAFAKDKFNYNKWGKVKIAAHLREKNINGDLIRSSLDTIDNELYKNAIKKLMSDHIRFIKAKNRYDLKAKLLRYGLSKGYESSLLYNVLNDIEN